MLGSIVVLLAPSLLPGWAMTSVLDGSSDRWRKMLLAPALGLLFLYGVSGVLLLADVWSAPLLWLCLIAMNAVAYRMMTVRHETLEKRSRWQQLEAAMHGEVSQETETTLGKEAEIQLGFQRSRSTVLLVLGVILALSALVSPLLQPYPFGVDWIGFAMLTQQLMLEGNLALSGTNEGFWTYPPAYPSLAAWLALSSGLDAGAAVFHLGHYTLFVLLLGLMGALDRHGSGGQAMLAMGLGLGLFAKTFDSGYPSVASQLGLVVGLLVLFRSKEQRERHHTLGFCLALLCVSLIHPTGAMYLALLLLSHVLVGLRLLEDEERQNVRRLAYILSAFVTVGFAVALLAIAPRLFEEAVFSEYGWQGGRPMVVYNAGLLVMGVAAALSLFKTLEGRIGITWFALLWALSWIHLIDGLQHVPVLSLLSYTLYSMALHAFHVPLAVLVALWWSPTTQLTPLGNMSRPPHTMPAPLSTVLVAVVVAGALFANAVALSLADHDELMAVAPGDIALREALKDVSGQVYTENMHWGYIWNAPPGMETTSIPTLGLVHMTSTEQQRATQALYNNNHSYIQERGMLHALTSPLGTMQWTLAQSPYWQRIHFNDGAALWQYNASGQAPVSVLSGVTIDACDGCEERLDPWRNHKFRDPMSLGPTRPFIVEGAQATVTVSPVPNARTWCLVYEVVGQTGGLYLQSSTGLERPYNGLRTDAGYHEACFALDETTALTNVTLSWANKEPTTWVNPLGLSGRDDVLLDRTGVKLQWMEWRT